MSQEVQWIRTISPQPRPRCGPLHLATHSNIGTVVSFLWIALWVAIALKSGSDARPVKLNEWGDFLAGVFAPLAFLWLVLGYLQQGEELQQNTEVLRQQAEELKASVLHQESLAQLAQSAADERAASKRAKQPRLRIKQGSRT